MLQNYLIIKQGYLQENRFDIKEFLPAQTLKIKNNWLIILRARILKKKEKAYNKATKFTMED